MITCGDLLSGRRFTVTRRISTGPRSRWSSFCGGRQAGTRAIDWASAATDRNPEILLVIDPASIKTDKNTDPLVIAAEVLMKGIAPERWSEIEELSAQDPGLLFDVILTLRQNLPLEVLQSSGLVIENLLQTAMIVTGKATYSSLLILLELPEVELIEEEGTVQALRL